MSVTNEPSVFDGESVLSSLQGVDSKLHNIKNGTFWVTNFRSIIRCEEREISIPHGKVTNITHDSLSSKKKSFTLRCRDFLDETFIASKDRQTKKLIELLKRHCSLKKDNNLFPFSTTSNSNGWDLFSPVNELERQCADQMKNWRVSIANSKYDLDKTLPMQLLAPTELGEEILFHIAQFRTGGRVQALTWMSSKGIPLLRCSSFNSFATSRDIVGSNEYIKLVLAMGEFKTIQIFDTCSTKKFPSHQYSQFISEIATINCLGISSESEIINSLKALRKVCVPPNTKDDNSLLEQVFRTGWPDHITQMLNCAIRITQSIQEGQPTIIQHPSGNKVLATLSALSQILMDSYYRTVKGFCLLIEKEFIYFGHSFGNFTSFSKRQADEHSSVFLVFLDAVWQIMNIFSHHFQFTDDLLLFLIDSVYSCRTGTFLPSCEREKISRGYIETESVWPHILNNEDTYYNLQYSPSELLLEENFDSQSWLLWKKFYLRHYTN